MQIEVPCWTYPLARLFVKCIGRKSALLSAITFMPDHACVGSCGSGYWRRRGALEPTSQRREHKDQASYMGPVADRWRASYMRPHCRQWPVQTCGKSQGVCSGLVQDGPRQPQQNRSQFSKGSTTLEPRSDIKLPLTGAAAVVCEVHRRTTRGGHTYATTHGAGAQSALPSWCHCFSGSQAGWAAFFIHKHWCLHGRENVNLPNEMQDGREAEEEH